MKKMYCEMERQYTEKTSSCLKTEILEKYFKHENTLIMKLSGPYFIIT